MRRWLRCDRSPHAYWTNIPGKVVVRCYCGRHIRPRLVKVEKP